MKMLCNGPRSGAAPPPGRPSARPALLLRHPPPGPRVELKSRASGMGSARTATEAASWHRGWHGAGCRAPRRARQQVASPFKAAAGAASPAVASKRHCHASDRRARGRPGGTAAFHLRGWRCPPWGKARSDSGGDFIQTSAHASGASICRGGTAPVAVGVLHLHGSSAKVCQIRG